MYLIMVSARVPNPGSLKVPNLFADIAPSTQRYIYLSKENTDQRNVVPKIAEVFAFSRVFF